jgi:hypothetical protein
MIKDSEDVRMIHSTPEHVGIIGHLMFSQTHAESI